MNTENVRLNITLPKDLVCLVDKISGPRKRSQFIAEAIRFKVKQDKKIDLEQQLSEGYRYCHRESLEIVSEFESADLENWDDQY